MKKILVLLLVLCSACSAAITDYYVATDASGGGDGLSEPNAFTWAEMRALLTGGVAAAGDRFNVKAGAYAITSADAWTNDGTAASPIIVSGYKTNPGDLDPGGAYDCQRTGAGNLVTTNMPIITYDATYALSASGSNYLILKNMNIVATKAGSSYTSGTFNEIHRCVFENKSTNAQAVAVTVAGGNVGLDCDGNLSGGSGGAAAFSIAGAYSTLHSCKVIASPAIGILSSQAGTILVNCNSSHCGTYGFYFSSTTAGVVVPVITGCLFHANHDAVGTAIIASAYQYPLVVIDTIITDSTAYGITALHTDYTGPIISAYNRFRDNATADTVYYTDWYAATNWGSIVSGATGDETTDYTNHATDLSPTATAPALASGVWGETIGAYQGGYPAASLTWNTAYTNGVAGTFNASDITVTGGAGATLSAPDIGDGIVVDDLTGTLAGGSGFSSAWVGSNPE